MFQKARKILAWYKMCIVRTRTYISGYTAIAVTVVMFKSMDIPMGYLPILVLFTIILIAIIGTADISGGIWKEENKICDENRPIVMEILRIVKEIKNAK